ncbi:MAG: hypothetical protein V3S51_08960 [Dehalococcoidia bacterium]
MSISSAVPIRERENALLKELRREGKPLRTGVLTERVLGRLGLAAPERKRTTPAGFPWWSGCLRFDLNRLREQGKVRRPSRGYWEIAGGNGDPSITPGPDKFSRRALNMVAELVRDAKSGDVPVLITMKRGEFTIKFGENIRQTSIEIAS